MKKRVRYLIYLLVTYLAVTIGVYAFQSKFIFLEKRLQANHKFNFENTFEEHFIKAENGEKINAIFFESPDSIDKGSLLYFHGNSRNLNWWGQFAKDFTQRGYDVLMIDYRGYGKSEGVPTEDYLFEDGQLAFDWLKRKNPNLPIVIYGRSLGSGVASYTASNNAAKAVILETPFNHIRSVVQTRYPFLILPVEFKHAFHNDYHLQKVDYPIHIFHGTNDGVVPLSCAEQLKPLLQKPEDFHLIDGGTHHNISKHKDYKMIMDEML